jgi:hypothetical protein
LVIALPVVVLRVLSHVFPKMALAQRDDLIETLISTPRVRRSMMKSTKYRTKPVRVSTSTLKKSVAAIAPRRHCVVEWPVRGHATSA